MSQKSVQEKHSELFHYTNESGLRGILESQTLWASDAMSLNDRTEIFHMRPKFEKRAYSIANAILREDSNSSFSKKRVIDASGGLHANSERYAKIITDVFYNETFGKHNQEPYAQPFVTSFCAHTKSSPYVRRNGLLSQWRGYGGEGGFALVFDTKRLWNCLNTEFNYYSYSAFEFGDVIYDSASDKVQNSFFKNFDKFLEKRVTNILAKNKETTYYTEMFLSFFKVASLYKHCGFEEEEEVRLAASPSFDYTLNSAIEQNFITTEKAKAIKLKSILTRGSGVNYIVLNNAKKKALPITRIIIGPQGDQDEAKKMVKKLLGGRNIPIHKSETPYIPSK